MAMHTRIAQASSTVIRLASVYFLRWALLPPLCPLIFGLFAVYLPSFVLSALYELQYEVVADEIDVAVQESIIDDVEDEVASGDETSSSSPEETVVEEIAIKETVVLQEKPPQFWRTLLTGAPSPRSLALSALTLLINLACVLMVADRLYSEHYETAEELSFVRVGYVSHTEAKLLVREPDQSKMPITIQIHVKDPKPPFENPLWQTAGGVHWTDNTTDYTAVVNIPLRFSSQRTYEWTSSNGHSGHFTAPPSPGKSSELHDGQFTFLATSCLISRLPYHPNDHSLAIPGMRHLAKVLPDLGAQFMLFLGDFIYIDVPRWWGKNVQDYRQKYRQVYASPDWPAVGQNLSWIHVLDDHEIANDWDKQNTGVYENAVEPWHHYHTAGNPPVALQAKSRKPRKGATYFEFQQGPASFFMLDTRSYRSRNSDPFHSENKTMLGAAQLEDFLAYLRRPEPKGINWKIVASSVPFTKNWRFNGKDTWGGFLAERQTVLEAMWDASVHGVGVVVLSGDRHEFAATAFPPPAGSRWSEGATVHEFSASPLSQFYSPIPSYFQTDDSDVKLKYINRGNSKFGAITLENLAEGDQTSLKYRLFVNGEEKWKTMLVSPARAEEKSSFWGRIVG